ncbi:glycosyl hydrolase family 18 protein [Fictibacillus sp. JL2B1089]|uniref:glycosyl hydrolase family 18 protein n=1 Tax=Fictibacillus sp. JL2B1089 TaxID=3399565 RepID=UPI003A898AAB
MKRLIAIISLFSLFSIVPITVEAAGNNTLSISSVTVNKANVYNTSKSSSQVISVLKKGEEYPIVGSAIGDSTTPIIHTVVSGNTLWILANQYGVSISELQKENRLTSTNLKIGQKIKIPQKYTIHSVIAKDTLWKIATKYAVTVNDLVKLNNLKSTSLYIGQKIKIPDYYYQIQLLEGKKGFIQRSKIVVKTQKRILLGWNYNGTTDSLIQQNKQPNLNVVSPRWYTLNNADSVVTNSADSRLVQSAHAEGKQVWPLFGNKFDPVLTDSVLSDAQKRQKLVTSLRDSLRQNGSDGINVDFENMDIKNKSDYVQFIRELKAALQPYGILVSVDVTRENEDPFWSGSFDRRELGKVADYIVLMGYDEHWGGSPVAGSVASLPWLRDGIELLMRDVPSHKIILGIPFYTREWVTNLSTNKVRSYDRTMKEVEAIIAAKGLQKTWDSKTSQNYVEYTENGEKHQIWVEDKTSIQHRMNYVNQYHLRGAAAWYIGSETQDVWAIFDSYR